MYPLARNQYINNSPEIFSCIRAGANTGATCIRPKIISLKNLANMQKMTPQKYFPVFARVRIQAPHVFAKKINSPRMFSCMYWFCAGGYVMCMWTMERPGPTCLSFVICSSLKKVPKKTANESVRFKIERQRVTLPVLQKTIVK